MQITPDILAIGGLGLVSILMLAMGLVRTGQQARIDRRLETLVPPLHASKVRIDQRFAVGNRLEKLLFMGRADREEVILKLRAAGYYATNAATVFAMLRLGAAVLAALAIFGVLASRDSLHGLCRIFPVAAFFVAIIMAKTVLNWRMSARQRQLRKELPFALDMLLLMLESGVGLDQCFRQLASVEANAMRKMRPVNVQLVDDIQNGMSYEAALERWADRLGIPGVHELASLFRQSLLYGTELGPALHIFVSEFADKRISHARESIGVKTTQITIVMILCMMPALFIVLMSPAVVSIAKAFHK